MSEHTIKCAECGTPIQAPAFINYYICEACKVKLEARPRKILEHAIKAAEQNTEVTK